MKFFEKEYKEKSYRFHVQRDGDSLWIHYQGQTWLWKSQQPSKSRAKKAVKSQGLIVSNLPGKIQRLFIQKGDKVERGQNLLILSAMKIEYSFKAERPGRVEDVFCQLGQNVDSGEKLVKIKYDE